MQKKNILDYDYSDLLAVVTGSFGEPAYRCTQILYDIYIRGVADFSEMSALPIDLRRNLSDVFTIGYPVLKNKHESRDGTVKYLWELSDGNKVESVLIIEGNRRTVCFSSQVGCALNCGFCATGAGGFKRNLTAGEILGQILAAGRECKSRISNCVAMGQGEPLLNYEASLKAFFMLNSPRMLNIGARHLTLSTCGIVPGIRRLASDNPPCGLAVSLHAAEDALRDKLMPINKKYPVHELKKACRYYADRTGKRITFEYLLLDGVNDNLRQARALVEYCRDLPCYINLIPYNPVPCFNWRRPSKKRIIAFYNLLRESGLEVCVRVEKGADIAAACGQLAQKMNEV